MAANTGPNSNTYIIPEVELGDTFNVWRDTTNTQTFKLNKLKVYDGVSSSSITLTLSEGGTFQAQIADNVGKGVTFVQPVVFSSGVTFNGDVTFNAQTFTVNANNVTIDDYAIVLGATSQASDANINAVPEGGAGILVSRGGGSTAAWTWRATRIQGLTGVWNSNAHIGLCGASAGLYPHNGGVLPIHGTGLRLGGTADGAHGLQIDLTNGNGVNSIVSLSRYSPGAAGSTAFAEVLSGSTYGVRPFLNIKDGANRKTIKTAGNHGLKFGMPVRLTTNNPPSYVAAQANGEDSAEVVGIVSSIISTTEFEITFIGEIFGNFSEVTDTGGNLTAGKTYYLSPSTPGKITLTQPTSSGTVHKAVLIATGTNSAVVIPFTGGVLTQSITLASSTSVAQRINQLNKFKIGDIIRFKASPSPVTLSYTVNGQPSNTVQETYQYGHYVLAEAGNNANLSATNADALNSTVAQVAGMIVGRDNAVYGTNYPANPNDLVYASFDVLMDGWFENSAFNLTPGTEYWLNDNVANSANPCFENPSKNSYRSDDSSISSFVRKKVFLATSPTSGYLYSYRGDTIQPTSTTVVSLSDSLITDLRSSIAGDLNIGVYNGGAAGGQKAIVISPAPTTLVGSGSKIGNVGIGNPSWTMYESASSGDRILAALDVVGAMRVGNTLAAGTIPGQDLLIARDLPDTKANGLTASTRLVIGTDHTDGNLVLGYKVRPSRTTRNAYLGSITGTHDRSVLVIGASAGIPVLRWRTAPSSAVSNLDTAVTMNEVFSIHGTTAAFSGSITGVTLQLSAKATSAATVSTDVATTLTTKGYVDSISITATQGVTGAGTSTGTTTNENGTFSELQKITVNAYAEISSLRVTVTPKSTNSKFYFSWDASKMQVQTRTPGTSTWTNVTGVFGVTRTIGQTTTRVDGQLDSPNTTSQVTYNFRAISSGTSGRQPRVTYVDPTYLTVIEI